MPLLLQSISPLSSSSPSTTTRRLRLLSPSLKLPKGRCICAAGGRSEDDYHATLKALKSRGRTPRKSLGQHYMLNSSINEQLASVAEVKDGDVILEIGPGTGSLTNVLLNAGATVVAVEKDKHMAMHVRDRFEGTDQLMAFITKWNYIEDETALRLVDASLGTSEYRPINIFVNFYSDPEYKFKVSRTNFFPQPNVDAAVVSFKLKQAANYPPVASAKSFFSMVNSAFNGKRKMLRRSLQHIRTSLELEKALENAGLPVTSRPGELTLDDFVRLHNLITNV